MAISHSSEIASLLPEKSKIGWRIAEVDRTWKVNNLNVNGRFFYLTFRDGQPTLSEFVDFIHSYVMAFCLPGDEIRRCKKRAQEVGVSAAFTPAIEKAESLFIQAIEPRDTQGEPGELILYLLLELILEAPQLLAKMSLKTNTEMPIHGADGVHMRFDDSTSKLHLIWGESKLHQELSSGVRSAMSSIAEFSEQGTDGRRREMEVIRDYMKLEDDELNEALLDYLDPYEGEEYNNVNEFYSCFLGFDYSKLSEAIAEAERNEVENLFLEHYEDRIDTSYGLIDKWIRSNSLESLHFIFFLLPFEDIGSLRSRFLNKLGVTVDDR